MTTWEVEVCRRAVNMWGRQSQLVICMEEMAELTKELSKNLRGQDNELGIAEEVADVEIMLEQIKLLYGIHNEVESVRAEKILRLSKREGRYDEGRDQYASDRNLDNADRLWAAVLNLPEGSRPKNAK